MAQSSRDGFMFVPWSFRDVAARLYGHGPGRTSTDMKIFRYSIGCLALVLVHRLFNLLKEEASPFFSLSNFMTTKCPT
jgi:hypothetical protein